MACFRGIRVQGFRGIRDLELSGLGCVNLIAGPNDVGKTALLEAIYQLSVPRNASLALQMSARRGVARYHFPLQASVPAGALPWTYLFRRASERQLIQLSAVSGDGGRLEVSLREVSPEEFSRVSALRGNLPIEENALGPQAAPPVQPSAAALAVSCVVPPEHKEERYYLVPTARGLVPLPPSGPEPFPAFFFSAQSGPNTQEDNQRFSSLVRRKQDQFLLDALQPLEPRITSLALLYHTGEPMIHAEIGAGDPIPLCFMGAGIARLASILLGIMEAAAGIVFVDEIENGIHYKNLPALWQSIASAARSSGAQIFATTHSLECIMAAHFAFHGAPPEDFGYRRLRFADGDIEAIPWDEEELDTANSIGLEVR